MLTREVITANATLAGLTDEQIAAVETLSRNDEEAVIGTRRAEFSAAVNSGLLEASGIGMAKDETTDAYLRRVVSQLKTGAADVETLRAQVADLTKKNETLEKNAGPETARALKQAKADLENITMQFNDLNTKYQNAETKHAAALHALQVDTEIRMASGGFKFKAGLPDNVTRVILNQAADKVRAMESEYVDDGKGGKVLAFKDEKGAILRNPNNQLFPVTVSELLERELKAMDVLAPALNPKGGGTGPVHEGKGGEILDLSAAKTRAQAYEIIASHLMAKGRINGSREFTDELNEIWVANNVQSLPTA